MATINGTSGSDTLNGTSNADTITAGAGNDIVNAGDGNDTVMGGAGNDTIVGGDGNDKLYGEDGNDTISGNAGNDTIDAGTGDDTIDGGSGNDTINAGDGNDVINGGADNDTINAGAGDDRIMLSIDTDVIDASLGNDTIDASNLTSGVNVNLLLGTVSGSGVRAIITGAENVVGTKAADVIIGDAGDNVLAGNGGNDTVSGGFGNDTLIAGGGQGQYFGDAGNDTLVWSAGTSGSQVFDGGLGTDTVRVDLTSAQLTSAALAELNAYNAFLADPLNAGKSFQFSAIGSLSVKGAEALSITVDGVQTSLAALSNSAPTIDAASPSQLTVAHGHSVSSAVMASDANGDKLAYAVSAGPSHGAVSLDAATGKFVYTAADFVGADTFTVSVSDGHGGVAQHTINVGLTNAGPTVQPTSTAALSVVHGHDVSGSVVGADADGDSLSYTVTAGPQHGSVSIDAVTGQYVYSAGTYKGADTFTLRVSDGHGGFADHAVNVDVTNTAPQVLAASETALSVVHGQSVAGHVVAQDIDGDAYKFTIATGPQHGTLVFTDESGSYVYKADDYVGYDNFTVRVADGLGGFADHVVQVNDTNTGPSINTAATTGFFSALYGSSTAGLVSAIDADGDKVTFTLKSGPAHGSVSVSADGHYTFNAQDYAGTDSFVVTASDGHGGTVDQRVDFGVIGTLDATSASAAVNVNLGTGAATGVDQAKMPWAINIAGSGFNDILYGDARDNVLSGGAGKDELHGAGGNDRVEGGIGDDKLFGEDGNDQLNAGDGNDALNGGGGNDVMRGGVGNDGFFGGGGNDVLWGDAGDDRLYGDGGDDILRGGAGNDTMTGAGFNNGGAKGANTYIWDRPDVVNADGSKAGLDHITDFGVGDRMDFTGLVSNHPAAVHDAVRVTDTAAGLVVAVDAGGTTGFVDVVILDNVHGLTVDDLAHQGSITV